MEKNNTFNICNIMIKFMWKNGVENMKKILIIILSIIASLGVISCDNSANNNNGNQTPPEEIIEYYVTFNANGGTPNPIMQTVDEDEKLIEPKIPTKEGFEFLGWYIGPDKTVKWDFNDFVNSNMTLHAKWEEITTDDPIIDDNKDDDKFESYGFEIIEIDLDDISISSSGIYNTMEEVGAYIFTYHTLPSNYRTKSNFNKSNYTKDNKLSCGGDRFYNREGILPSSPTRTYTECDIDYRGGSRNAKRIVYSSDYLIFYTDDHYATFKILRFINGN